MKNKFLITMMVILGFMLININCSSGDSEENLTNPSSSSSESTMTLSGSISVDSTAASGYGVVVQNNSTGEVGLSSVGSDGSFSTTISSSITSSAYVEGSNSILAATTPSFTVSIVDANGSYVTPVAFGSSNTNTAFSTDTSTDLGGLDITTSGGKAIIPISSNVNSDKVDSNYVTTVDSNGIANGIKNNVGKGGTILGSGDLVSDSKNLDRDKDGIPNIFDADNIDVGLADAFKNGNDYDVAKNEGIPSTKHLESSNAWYEMKVSANDPKDLMRFYSGTDKATARNRSEKLVFIFNEKSDNAITSIKLNTAASPSWVTGAKSGAGLWKDQDYAVICNASNPNEKCRGDIYPNAEIKVGEAFFFDISYSDGSKDTVMKSFTFRFDNIPKLVKYGNSSGAADAITHCAGKGTSTPASTGGYCTIDYTNTDIQGDAGGITFDASGDPSGNGNTPIQFDASQDLELYFEPPKDESGNFLNHERLNKFAFEIFYETPSQIQASSTDFTGTFVCDTGGTKNLNTSFTDCVKSDGAGHDYTYSWNTSGRWEAIVTGYTSDNMYKITIPKGILVATVNSTAINRYKIDIAPQKNGANAAVMLYFRRQ